MNKKKLTGINVVSWKKSLLVITVAALAAGCHKPDINEKDLRDFKQVNLVANKKQPYYPVTVDQTLINGFGIAWSPSRIAWVNSVGGHVSELYTTEGAIFRPPVNIPSGTEATGGFPCGIVFSGGKGFNLSNGPATFLFTGFEGVLSGWNGGTNATRIKNPPNSSYTGLAIGASGGHNFIYAANFGARRIDVWDTAFSLVRMTFKDPSLPGNYSPYNIQAVGEWLFVIYAELGADGHGVPGSGKGYVSVFNTDGTFVKRFASKGTLNIPWGVVMAPASFLENKDMGDDHGGGYGDKVSGSSEDNNNYGNHDPKDPVILVGNFGDGRINVYSLDGKYLGQLKSHNHTIVIDGLWALSFAPSASSPSNIDPSRLYFTAGPEKESDGLFGYLIKQ